MTKVLTKCLIPVPLNPFQKRDLKFYPATSRIPPFAEWSVRV